MTEKTEFTTKERSKRRRTKAEFVDTILIERCHYCELIILNVRKPRVFARFNVCSTESMLTDPFRRTALPVPSSVEAIRVHRATGPGLLESAYSPCLVLELQEAGLSVAVQHAIPLIYRGINLDVGYRADMLVDRDGAGGAEVS